MKGYRTIVFNLLVDVIAFAGIVMNYIGMLGLTDRQVALASIILVAVTTFGNKYLRSITTTPLGKKL